MRYERKYRIENLDFPDVLSIIHNHPAGFAQEFPQRKVNNIYLDSSDLQAFRQKLNGVPNRAKFRIRWYGENILAAKHPSLETKISSNGLREKLSRQIPSFKIVSMESLRSYVKETVQAEFNLEPVLLNSFRRNYFASSDGLFRVTVDSEIEFKSLGQGFFSILNMYKDAAIIVEIKYPEISKELWPEIETGFPFPRGKNSKYVTGMVLTGRGID